MSKPPTLLAGLLILVAIFAGSASPAIADDGGVQDRIDEVLLEFPGGDQVAWNQVSWDNGAIVLTVAATGGFTPFSIGSCASGYYCAFSGSGYSGSQLTFSGCSPNNSVAPLGAPVRSIANARVFGTVSAYSGSTFQLSVGAGAGTNTGASITKLSCS